MYIPSSSKIYQIWYIYYSPVATGRFGGLSPPKQNSKPPKLKYEAA